MKFDPNGPSVKGNVTGSEASPKQDLGHDRWTFDRPSVTCANALGYSYHLKIWLHPQRNQSWIICPSSVWAQTPFVYCKAEIRSTHIVCMCICSYIWYVYIYKYISWVSIYIHTYTYIYVLYIYMYKHVYI